MLWIIGARIACAQEITPRKVVHTFFNLVHQGRYQEAYDCFSKSVRREVSMQEFKKGAQDVKYLKLLEIKVQDKENNLIKLKVRAIIHLFYKSNLYEAVYEGKVNLYLEKNTWKIETVNLKAVSQKTIKTNVKPEKLQKLDFGTT